jgi:hypothetical protein
MNLFFKTKKINLEKEAKNFYYKKRIKIIIFLATANQFTLFADVIKLNFE